MSTYLFGASWVITIFYERGRARSIGLTAGPLQSQILWTSPQPHSWIYSLTNCILRRVKLKINFILIAPQKTNVDYQTVDGWDKCFKGPEKLGIEKAGIITGGAGSGGPKASWRPESERIDHSPVEVKDLRRSWGQGPASWMDPLHYQGICEHSDGELQGNNLHGLDFCGTPSLKPIWSLDKHKWTDKSTYRVHQRS